MSSTDGPGWLGADIPTAVTVALGRDDVARCPAEALHSRLAPAVCLSVHTCMQHIRPLMSCGQPQNLGDAQLPAPVCISGASSGFTLMHYRLYSPHMRPLTVSTFRLSSEAEVMLWRHLAPPWLLLVRAGKVPSVNRVSSTASTLH